MWPLYRDADEVSFTFAGTCAKTHINAVLGDRFRGVLREWCDRQCQQPYLNPAIRWKALAYTTSMIRGLVEQGPGHAWKARLLYGILDDRLLLQVAYARYTTVLSGDSHDAYVDVTWKLDRWMKGLSVRDRWERSTGGVGLNLGNESFVYNRLMVDYKF